MKHSYPLGSHKNKEILDGIKDIHGVIKKGPKACPHEWLDVVDQYVMEELAGHGISPTLNEHYIPWRNKHVD